MAFDFDLLCTIRLFYYDNARASEPLERMLAELGGQAIGKKTDTKVVEPEVW